MGSWVRTGAREFTGTFWRLIFDERGEFIGRQRARSQIRLNADLAEFTAASSVDFYDAAGAFERTVRTTTTARRMSMEAPDPA